MTAVLIELRRLNAARQRGDITDREFARIRVSLENAIEDVPDIIDGTANETQATPDIDPMENVRIWHIFVFIGVLIVVGTALVTWLVGSFELALTLAATLLAALTVHVFKKTSD